MVWLDVRRGSPHAHVEPYNNTMTAYILRWRGEAEVVARYKEKRSEPVACDCLVLKAMAANQERIRKLSRTYHEQRLVHTPPASKLAVY